MKSLKKYELNLTQTFFIIIVMFLAIIQPFRQLSDPDMFWHIETGTYILDNFSIPKTDIFSYYGIENNLPWIAHEWLSDVVFALIYKIGGYSLLRFFPMLMLTIIFCYINKKSKIFSEIHIENYLWFFFAFLMISSFSEVRAHMFSWLFCAITINVLFEFVQNQNSKKIYYLPLISCLWVNMHGGSSSLIFVLLLLFIIIPTFNFKFLKFENKKMTTIYYKKLIIIFLCCICTALINPNTYKILLYPFENMQDKLMLSVIIEWHSPNFHTFDGFMIFLFLAIIVTIIVSTEKKINLLDFILLGAFVYLSLKSIRQTVYLSIVSIPIIIKYLPHKLNVSNIKKISYTFIVFILSILCLSYVVIESQKPIIDTKEYPSEISMQKIETLAPKRMLNNYNWGGYIIKQLHNKNIYPFIDGRADVYSKYTLSDFTKLMYLSKDWEKILDKYEFDCIFMDTNNMFTREIKKLNNWEEFYSDDKTTILVKKN